MLDLLSEILSEPSFKEEELELFKENTIQKLKYNNSKCDVRAYRQITESIFGPDHPYGYNSSIELIRGLERDDLIQHYSRFYNASNCRLMVSGKVTPEVISMIDEKLSKALLKGEKASPKLIGENTPPIRINDKVEHAIQTSIRIGKKMFSRSHKDYEGMYVLNTILGCLLYTSPSPRDS